MLKRLNWTHHEKPFLYVKKGREGNREIVLDIKHGRWMLDTDSNVVMIRSDKAGCRALTLNYYFRRCKNGKKAI